MITDQSSFKQESLLARIRRLESEDMPSVCPDIIFDDKSGSRMLYTWTVHIDEFDVMWVSRIRNEDGREYNEYRIHQNYNEQHADTFDHFPYFDDATVLPATAWSNSIDSEVPQNG